MAIILAASAALILVALEKKESREGKGKLWLDEEGILKLPAPSTRGSVSVEEAISKRRSRRSFSPKELGMSQVSQLLWSGQGITDPLGVKRAAPSAGATYPCTLLLVVGEGGVKGLDAGVYEYIPEQHALRLLISGDVRRQIANAALGQMFIAQAPISIMVTARYERTTRVYGERGVRYVHIEVGHIGQNLYLQAEALGLSTVIVGAFDDEELSSVVGLEAGQTPLAVMPFGHRE